MRVLLRAQHSPENRSISSPHAILRNGMDIHIEQGLDKIAEFQKNLRREIIEQKTREQKKDQQQQKTSSDSLPCDQASEPRQPHLVSYIFGEAYIGDTPYSAPQSVIHELNLGLIASTKGWLLSMLGKEVMEQRSAELMSANQELTEKLETECTKNSFLINEVTHLNAALHAAKVEKVEAERKSSEYEQKWNEAEQKIWQLTAELAGFEKSTTETFTKFIQATKSTYLDMCPNGDFNRILQSLAEPSTVLSSSPGTSPIANPERNVRKRHN